ncbi:MAG: Lrp/AsnC family transcriptional regulator [Sphingomonadales bacterium]|nr:Lrp/AsnC family transcriptional regulator [Sphingomonadales bacterium]MDE2171094.1 Lrp/AsnC family transcriptional regulator [Sphingomonadales bacterium]
MEFVIRIPWAWLRDGFHQQGLVLVSEKPGLDFDMTDFRIMRALSEDGRMSDVMLGEQVNLSSTAAARRRKILEDRGAIAGYTASLDMPMLGLGIVVMVAIELKSQTDQVLGEFEAAVVRCPSVTFCSFVSGDTDFLMMVHVRSFDDYDRVYRSELAMLPHVAKIRSSFVMRRVTQRGVPPVIFGRDWLTQGS